MARLCRRRWGQAAAGWRGMSTSGVGRLWCAHKHGVGAARAWPAAYGGGGMAVSARENSTNARRGEGHEHHEITTALFV